MWEVGSYIHWPSWHLNHPRHSRHFALILISCRRAAYPHGEPTRAGRTLVMLQRQRPQQYTALPMCVIILSVDQNLGRICRVLLGHHLYTIRYVYTFRLTLYLNPTILYCLLSVWRLAKWADRLIHQATKYSDSAKGICNEPPRKSAIA